MLETGWKSILPDEENVVMLLRARGSGEDPGISFVRVRNAEAQPFDVEFHASRGIAGPIHHVSERARHGLAGKRDTFVEHASRGEPRDVVRVRLGAVRPTPIELEGDALV